MESKESFEDVGQQKSVAAGRQESLGKCFLLYVCFVDRSSRVIARDLHGGTMRWMSMLRLWKTRKVEKMSRGYEFACRWRKPTSSGLGSWRFAAAPPGSRLSVVV